MAHKGLAIMIADKMPSPDKLAKHEEHDGEYDGYSDGDGEEGHEEGDDEQMELDTMRDFRQCIKDGDDKGALGHLRDLVDMLSEPGEKEEE